MTIGKSVFEAFQGVQKLVTRSTLRQAVINTRGEIEPHRHLIGEEQYGQMQAEFDLVEAMLDAEGGL